MTTPNSPTSSTQAPYRDDIEFDHGLNGRARIGFVLLAMEQTMEHEIFRLTPPGVGVYFQRAPMANAVNVETLTAMAPHIGDAAGMILPDLPLDVICYGCTSGSVVIGEDRVFAELQRGAPGATPTSLITAVMNALDAVGAKRISVATPYVDEVNEIERNYLVERGYDVLNISGLGIANDEDMARVSPDYLEQFGAEVDDPDSDALFISCGALRSTEIVDRLEQRLGKPVITSNQATVWDCLRKAGVPDQLEGSGVLFRDH